MALFAFLKKSRGSSIVSSTTKKSGEATRIFKGDLAFIQDADVFPEGNLNTELLMQSFSRMRLPCS